MGSIKDATTDRSAVTWIALTLINNLHLGECNLYLVPECFYDTYGGSCATQRWAAMNSSVTAVSISLCMISIAPAKSVQCLDSARPRYWR